MNGNRAIISRIYEILCFVYLGSFAQFYLGERVHYAILAAMWIFMSGFAIESIVKWSKRRHRKPTVVVRFDVSALNQSADECVKAIKEMASKMGGGS